MEEGVSLQVPLPFPGGAAGCAALSLECAVEVGEVSLRSLVEVYVQGPLMDWDVAAVGEAAVLAAGAAVVEEAEAVMTARVMEADAMAVEMKRTGLVIVLDLAWRWESPAQVCGMEMSAGRLLSFLVDILPFPCLDVLEL